MPTFTEHISLKQPAATRFIASVALLGSTLTSVLFFKKKKEKSSCRRELDKSCKSFSEASFDQINRVVRPLAIKQKTKLNHIDPAGAFFFETQTSTTLDENSPRRKESPGVTLDLIFTVP